jgi:hypothetical protein
VRVSRQAGEPGRGSACPKDVCYGNVEIVFLSPKTAALLLPFTRASAGLSKPHTYTCLVFDHIWLETDAGPNTQVADPWSLRVCPCR